MKKQDVLKLIDPSLSKDEIRRILFSRGLDNLYQEMEMESPLVDTHQDISYTSDHVVQHSHLFYEVIYCEQGDLDYLMGVRRYHIQTGDIVIAPPGTIHSPILPKEMVTPYKRYVLWISTVFAQTLRDRDSHVFDFQDAMVLRTAGTKWEYLQRFFVRAIRESETKAPGWQICLGGIASQLIVHLTRAAHVLQTTPRNPKGDMLEGILDYVQGRLSEKISIQETAQVFHISASTLTHLFQREMGISFYRCVTQRRLVESKNLIAAGQPMEQISMAVGFQEYSAFYRAFKAEYGISPMQYRKMLQLSE